MENPVLVEVTRGGRVESRHRGALALVDAKGATVKAIGDVEQAVFPRSAVKAIQALLLVESGAADAYGFGDRELALASASHGGEPGHAALAAAMLARAGLSESALECGAHAPSYPPAAEALIREGRAPSQLHNNCSGKHAGFLCTACHHGWDHAGYVRPNHPVQRAVGERLASLTGAALGEPGIDGCSIPTYAIPIRNLALGFARLATGEGLAPERAKASKRIVAACQAEPWFVAGTGRFCTEAMKLYSDRLFVKTGAEGVFCAAFPTLGVGLALKCDDGTGRASEAITAAVVEALLGEAEGFAARVRPPIKSVRGAVVGEIRPAPELSAALRG